MNDTTSTNGTPGRPSGAPGGPRASDRFFAWLRGLGIARTRGDRWFAGVAGGVAAKAGIDPLIVRGVFVVLAVLGGPGILLYLAAWLLLPDPEGRIHAEELFRGRASAGVIVAAVILGLLVLLPALVSILSTVFSGPSAWVWTPIGILPEWLRATLGVIWWAILLPAAIIWLIVWLSRGGARGKRDQSRGTPSGEGSPHEGSASASDFTDRAASFADRAEQYAHSAGGKAQEWGHLAGERASAWGEQAEAWSRKAGEDARARAEREREERRQRGPGAAHIVLTLALALLSAGATAAWAVGTGVGADALLTLSLVTATAVLAASMIIAGVRGRESGWVGFLAFCGAIALVFAPFSTTLPEQTRFVPVGSIVERADRSGPDAAVLMIAGSVRIDLTDLTSRSTAREIELWLFSGNSTVELPATGAVRVRTDVLAGNIAEERGDERLHQAGPFLSRTVGANLDLADADAITEVRIRLLAGNVRIENADGSTAPTIGEDDRTGAGDERTEEFAQIRADERQTAR